LELAELFGISCSVGCGKPLTRRDELGDVAGTFACESIRGVDGERRFA
jgi:hypothetical protein